MKPEYAHLPITRDQLNECTGPLETKVLKFFDKGMYRDCYFDAYENAWRCRYLVYTSAEHREAAAKMYANEDPDFKGGTALGIHEDTTRGDVAQAQTMPQADSASSSAPVVEAEVPPQTQPPATFDDNPLFEEPAKPVTCPLRGLTRNRRSAGATWKRPKSRPSR